MAKDKVIREKPYPDNIEGEWGARFLNPMTSCANIAHTVEGPTHISTAELGYGLENLVDVFNRNDVKAIQEILLPQAIALQSVFEMATKKMMGAKFVNELNAWSAIAFRAQEQSRKTLSTLMAIRQPRQVAFVKQQNYAFNQQVNNGVERSQPENLSNSSNELLSRGEYEELDTRSTSQTIIGDTTMETVESVNGAKD